MSTGGRRATPQPIARRVLPIPNSLPVVTRSAAIIRRLTGEYIPLSKFPTSNHDIFPAELETALAQVAALEVQLQAERMRPGH